MGERIGVEDVDCRDTWLGLRGGGGAGAWLLPRVLDERDSVESCDDLRMFSSGREAMPAGDIALGTVAAEVLPSCRWCRVRGGGGAGFLESGRAAPVVLV